MKNKKWLSRSILYLSVPFLLIYLVKFDYLEFKNVSFNYFYLVVSLLFLFLGFAASTFSWKVALVLHGNKVSASEALISHGLSVFAKYIPGKVWVILGRAAYIAELKKLKVSGLSFISLKEQLLYILVGLLVSLIPSILYFNNDFWVLIILLTIIGLSALLFVKPLHDFSEKLLSKLFKKNFTFPLLSLNLSMRLSFVILTYWSFWITAFLFLVLSITHEFEWIYAFAFPLAVCYGVLAIVMPGGLGVREGIIVAFLTATGLELETSVLISVISRLWFISGEIFIFSLSVILKQMKK